MKVFDLLKDIGICILCAAPILLYTAFFMLVG